MERRRQQFKRQIDGGNEEIASNLRRANRFQEESRKWIRNFWKALSKEENLSTLSDVVAVIEKNEKRAETIYSSLFAKFPKVPRVLRAYGNFLEEIKNDTSKAQAMFRRADDIEEETSTKHTSKQSKIRLKKKKKVHMSEVTELENIDVKKDNWTGEDIETQ